jgi:hypothetical protein
MPGLTICTLLDTKWRRVKVWIGSAGPKFFLVFHVNRRVNCLCDCYNSTVDVLSEFSWLLITDEGLTGALLLPFLLQ